MGFRERETGLERWTEGNGSKRDNYEDDFFFLGFFFL